MSTPIDLDYGYSLIIFNGDEEDKSHLYELQDNIPKDKLIYVALNGTDDKYLHPDRFMVENYQTSMESHFLYHGKILPKEREEYIIEKALQFRETGKQMFIEEYEFTSAEPFYDYSK